MGWPYKFLTIPPEERHQRRLVLDRYGVYAQLLVLAPVAVGLAVRLSAMAATAAASRARRARGGGTGGGGGGSYDAVPDSPSLKSQRLSARGTWASRARQLRWWLADDVRLFGQHWGHRDQWLLGGVWASLLLVLCVLETGKDYLHLTKRFGIVAASQLPLQYLLALKYLNPFAFVFGASHEQVNRYHRVLGRIVYGLFCAHAGLYLNYFVGVGVPASRFVAPVVLAGFTALALFSLMNWSAVAAVRRYSYRLFFVAHLAAAFALPPVIFFHARPARLYAAEALLVFVADLVCRKAIFTVASQATLEPIPGTALIRLSAPLPYHRASRFRDLPGAHVYLSLPADADVDPKPLVLPFLHNPFTVAAVNEETGDITLVARRRAGPMTAILAQLAGLSAPERSSSSSTSKPEAGKLAVNIEGPYGAAAHFPNLAGGRFDRVLLVAGGVGATFAVPIYRALVHDSPAAKVSLVWAVRSAGDATWAVVDDGQAQAQAPAQTADGKSLLADDNVHIFLTGDLLDSAAPARSPPGPSPSASGAARSSAADGEVEMSALHRDRHRNRYAALRNNRRRPDLKKVVDDAFKHGNEERVAVLVCGPDEMARETREHVRHWVMKGRSVWFHSESFGW